MPYIHGHHESVLRSHTWRTVANSAPHLLEHLRPGQRVLDVGCGPGTITAEIAGLVAPGEVIGVDASEEVLERARRHAAESGVEVTYQVADAFALPFADDSFDVVHAHQVLQHVPDPVAMIREMRRVARPGGVVALREGDYGALTWFPPSEGLEEWRHLYHDVSAANGVEADAGRHVLSWALAAGFSEVRPTASVWCFATPEDRAWWSSLWADRVVASEFARQAKEYGLADDVALEALRDAWRAWGAAPDGWYTSVHGEVIATA